VITETKNEAKAQGLAEGKAEDKFNEIRRLMAKGWLTVDAARTKIRELVESSLVPQARGAQALEQPG
jgi:hypothetical protein